jgi:hypothetical protein
VAMARTVDDLPEPMIPSTITSRRRVALMGG